MATRDIEKKRATGRRYAARNKGKIAVYQAEWYQKNKAKRRKQIDEWRGKNPEKHAAQKQRDTDALRIRKRELTARLVEHFGGKCLRCAVEDEPCIYDFHHRDPSKKTMNIAKLICYTKDWDVLLAEASKCDLLCSNCHRKVHFGHGSHGPWSNDYE